uniref:Uncharacterized protein n=1 Tax=Bigelowiella natans TaxID=227086 RepID=A0A7S2P5H4_BIGNA|mmetsp:Transcript_1507/g.2254  ORF Transcript_1507/g.2254 Transcript_1507/m.2254 type:complete len:440 (+) Transcript_1507:347-1666(+)
MQPEVKRHLEKTKAPLSSKSTLDLGDSIPEKRNGQDNAVKTRNFDAWIHTSSGYLIKNQPTWTLRTDGTAKQAECFRIRQYGEDRISIQHFKTKRYLGYDTRMGVHLSPIVQLLTRKLQLNEQGKEESEIFIFMKICAKGGHWIKQGKTSSLIETRSMEEAIAFRFENIHPRVREKHEVNTKARKKLIHEIEQLEDRTRLIGIHVFFQRQQILHSRKVMVNQGKGLIRTLNLSGEAVKMPSILTRPSLAKLLKRVPYLSQAVNKKSSSFRYNPFATKKQDATSFVKKEPNLSFRGEMEASIRKEIQTSLQGMQFQLDLITEKEIEETERIILTFCKAKKQEIQNTPFGESKQVCTTESKLPTSAFEDSLHDNGCGDGFCGSSISTDKLASRIQPNKQDLFGSDTHCGSGWNEQWSLDMCQRFASEDIREATSIITASYY